jgi:hypothetical protein
MFSRHSGSLARLVLCSVLLAMVLGGCAQQGAPTAATPVQAATEANPPSTPASPAPTNTPAPTSTPMPTSTPLPTATPRPIAIAPAQGLPAAYAETAKQMIAAKGSLNGRALRLAEAGSQADVTLALVPLSAKAISPLAQRYYAVVAPFATVRDDIPLAELHARWQAKGEGPLYASQTVADELAPVLGSFGGTTVAEQELVARLEGQVDAVGVLPFDKLDPRFKVLTIEGSNILDGKLDTATYPLAMALVADGPEAGALRDDLAKAFAPSTNRDPGKLTTLIMTGVTAMTRMTALKMEQKGYTYPAEIISGTLKAADITHVSNEVPFIKGCEVNATPNNLTMCSDYTYWAALEAIGTDIVGLSGNHVNDFGRDGARESIQFYRDRKIPIYGSGLNVQEACAPLMWEHNGNTFAFVAALAFDPEFAWATDTQPGACYFYNHKDEVLSLVKELSQKVDIVAVELQYYETYQPNPTDKQVEEFRELRAAGADIVTGVQSHVPQAMEPYGMADAGGPGVIVYGLGNLFFDQMWSWETRTELYVRHTIYDGRALSTEILTGVLEDYAQPRWATAEERAEILSRIYDGAPARP